MALITGAARGIGKAIALKFAAEGADIAFTDLVIDESGKQTQSGFTATDISCYNDVHGSVRIGCFTIHKIKHFPALVHHTPKESY